MYDSSFSAGEHIHASEWGTIFVCAPSVYIFYALTLLILPSLSVQIDFLCLAHSRSHHTTFIGFHWRQALFHSPCTTSQYFLINAHTFHIIHIAQSVLTFNRCHIGNEELYQTQIKIKTLDANHNHHIYVGHAAHNTKSINEQFKLHILLLNLSAQQPNGSHTTHVKETISKEKNIKNVDQRRTEKTIQNYIGNE